jgi:hypothetical protein
MKPGHNNSLIFVTDSLKGRGLSGVTHDKCLNSSGILVEVHACQAYRFDVI